MRSMMPETAVDDRRTHHRVPLVCDVWQRSESGEPLGRLGQHLAGLTGKTLNLSDGGALIRLTHLPDGAAMAPKPGQSIELTVAVPRTTADTFLLEHVRVKGEVVRVSRHADDQPPSVFAVRFPQPLPLQLD